MEDNGDRNYIVELRFKDRDYQSFEITMHWRTMDNWIDFLRPQCEALYVTDSDNGNKRCKFQRLTLEQWREKTTVKNGPRFTPFDGRCSACGVNLVSYYNITGRISATGCPKCNRSYVD